MLHMVEGSCGTDKPQTSLSKQLSKQTLTDVTVNMLRILAQRHSYLLLQEAFPAPIPALHFFVSNQFIVTKARLGKISHVINK